MNLTIDEIRELERWMDMLAPGYRIFDLEEMQGGIDRAERQLKKHPAVRLNGAVNFARLVRHVCTDPERQGYGVPYVWWWILFESEMMRGLTQDPWSEVKWWAWDRLRGKAKNLTMWGSQSSGKSSWGSRFGVCQMAAWLEDAMIYVGGPFKEHTDDKAWAELAGWVRHLRATGPKNDFITSLGIGFKTVGEEALIYDREQRDNAGTAKFVALESASAIQGKKTERHDEAGLIGISMLMIDEFIENPGLKLKRGEGNYSSNSNYFGLFPCNPDPEKVQHPAVLPFSDPVDMNRENLRKETNFRWRTAYGELIRFCWQNSPNRILGRTVWPYLLNQRRHDNAKEKGSDIIAAQIEAWGFGLGANNAPLDAAAIKNAGTYNSVEQLGGWQSDRQRVMHIDCAFGGADPATCTILESGIATMIFGQAPVTRRCFSGVEQGKFQVDADFRWSKAWHDEMEELMRWSGGSFPKMALLQGFTEGQLMGGAWHLAGQVLRKAYDLEIPPTHICFDSSQRGDCTDVMISALGRHNIQWWYEGTRRLVEEEAQNRGGWYRWPYVYELNEQTGESEPLLWSKVCTQVISMIWLFSCEVIRHSYLINGDKVKKGLEELCARQIVRGRGGQTEGRKDVMGKDKLKDMGLPSPTWGEGLATAIYFGARFKNMIQLDAPKLTMSAASPIAIESIIRAPGGNRRFNAQQWR